MCSLSKAQKTVCALFLWEYKFIDKYEQFMLQMQIDTLNSLDDGKIIIPLESQWII